MHWTSIGDSFGVASRQWIEVDNIVWSSDYLHTAFTSPHARDIIKRDFTGGQRAGKAQDRQRERRPTLRFDLDKICEGGNAMYIDHVGVNTNDMEATLQFYCGILGMRLIRTTRTPDGRRHYNVEIGGGNAFAVFDGAELPTAASANM